MLFLPWVGAHFNKLRLAAFSKTLLSGSFVTAILQSSASVKPHTNPPLEEADVRKL